MHLKIVSFNIRCCDDPNGHAIAERAPRLYEALSPIAADLIGLQEYTPKWDEFIRRDFGGEYEIFNQYRSVDSLESAPILWRRDRFACVKKGYFWLSDTPDVESRGWDERFNCYRICEYVVLEEKTSGQRFTYFNTHYGFGDSGQIRSGELIYARSQSVAEGPVLLTGDFNLHTDFPGYEVLTRYFTDVNAATRGDNGTTYHGYNPKEHPDEHIDFCFVSDAVKPLDQKIIRTTVDGRYPSDHYGLEIDVEL